MRGGGPRRRPGETAAVSVTVYRTEVAGNKPWLLPNTANETRTERHALPPGHPRWSKPRQMEPDDQLLAVSRSMGTALASHGQHPKRRYGRASVHQSLSAATGALLSESLCGTSDSGGSLLGSGLTPVSPPMAGSFALGVKDLASS